MLRSLRGITMTRTIDKNRTWIVISDPLPIGGFESGTKFSCDDVVYMLRSQAFTIGTVLLHGEKGRFVVKHDVKRCDPLQLVNAQKVLIAYGQRLVNSRLEPEIT